MLKAEALFHSELLTFEVRRQRTCDKRIKEIMEDPNHKLHPLLPELNTDAAYSLRTSLNILNTRWIDIETLL